MKRLLTLLTLLAVTTPLAADRIRLANGNTLEGALRALPDGSFEVRLDGGRIVLPASQVVAVERAATRAELLRRQVAALDPGDPKGRYRLALEARSARLFSLERCLLEQAIARDPDHALARAALGYRHHEGRWLREDEWRAARGEVRFRERWVPAAERDATLGREQAAREAAARAALAALERARLQQELARLEQEVERLQRRRILWVVRHVHHPLLPVVEPPVILPPPAPRSTRVQTPRPIPPGGLPLAGPGGAHAPPRGESGRKPPRVRAVGEERADCPDGHFSAGPLGHSIPPLPVFK